MQVYEAVLIARQDISESQVQDLVKEYSDVLSSEKGKILKTEFWGLRNLSYRINKNRKGHYVLIESETEAAQLQEIERRMRLSEDILRYMSIKLEEPSKTASPQAKDEKEAA